MKNDRAKLNTLMAATVAVTALAGCAAKTDDIETHYQKAREYMGAHQPEKALEEADWLVRSGKIKDSEQLQKVFLLEGAAYVDLKDLKKAAQAFDNASDTQPPNPVAYEALGEVLYEDRQYKDAIPAFDEALKLNNRDKRSYHLRAMARLATGGDAEQSLADLDHANALDPADAEIANDYVTNAEFFEKFRLGLYILDLLKEHNPSADIKDTHDRIWKEAFQQAKEDHDKRPNAPVPYAYAAYLFLDNNDATSARQSVDRGMQMHDGENVPLLWRIKGDLAARDGKYEEALSDYDKAIKVFVKPKDVDRDLGSEITQLHREKVLKKLGRTS